MDAGLRLIRVPVATIGSGSARYSHTLNHSLELYLNPTDAKYFERVPLKLAIQLRSLAAGTEMPIDAEFSGTVTPFKHLATYREGREEVGLLVDIPIPPDAWLRCPRCELRVKELEILKPDSTVGSGWNVRRLKWQQMKDELGRLPDPLESYETLSAARALFRLGRHAEAAVVYDVLVARWPNLLTPADTRELRLAIIPVRSHDAMSFWMLQHRNTRMSLDYGT